MSSDADFIAYLDDVSAHMNRYGSILIFIFGATGNILNTLVLSQRAFRLNPCAIYFLFSSVANLVVLLSGLVSRTLSGWAADLTNTDRTLCKLRAFIVNVARLVAFWLILLAAIDRWLLSHSNIRYRQMSTVKNAKRGVIIVLIFSILVFSHIIYCYEPNLINAPLKCYGVNVACRFATDLSFAFLIIIIPVVLMFIFGSMTINNIRRSRNRIQPINTPPVGNALPNRGVQQRDMNRTDYRLIVMLLVQILLLFIFGFPLGAQKLYVTITTYRPTSPVQAANDNFGYNVVLLLNFLANGMPFYIYTLFGGNVFRAAFSKILLSVRKRVCCRHPVFHR